MARRFGRHTITVAGVIANIATVLAHFHLRVDGSIRRNKIRIYRILKTLQNSTNAALLGGHTALLLLPAPSRTYSAGLPFIFAEDLTHALAGEFIRSQSSSDDGE